MKSHNKDGKMLTVSMIQIKFGGKKASNQAPIKEELCSLISHA